MVEQIWKGKEVTHRFVGKTSTEEIKNAVIRVAGDSRFDDVSEIIFDFSECQGAVLRPEVIEEIAALDGAASISNPRIRITVLTDRPEIIEAMRTYINSGLSNYPVRIFPSVAREPRASLLANAPPITGFSFGY